MNAYIANRTSVIVGQCTTIRFLPHAKQSAISVKFIMLNRYQLVMSDERPLRPCVPKECTASIPIATPKLNNVHSKSLKRLQVALISGAVEAQQT